MIDNTLWNRLPLWSLILGIVAVFATPAARASEEPPGKKVFTTHHCNACHTVASADIKLADGDAPADEPASEAEGEDEVPPDLSDVGSKTTKEFLDGYLLKKEKLDGKLHRKRFRGSPEERASLVEWLCTLKAEPKK